MDNSTGEKGPARKIIEVSEVGSWDPCQIQLVNPPVIGNERSVYDPIDLSEHKAT